MWTIRTLLEWSTPWLAERGVDSPRLDSELLLANALKIRRIDLFLDPHRPLLPTELALFKPLIKRRAAREPIAYILGHREFWGLEISTNGDVLIPRPESELLVETTLAHYPERETPLNILELCVGSGAVLCALLTEYPQAKGHGTDLSLPALQQATHNAKKLELTERVVLIQSDLDMAIPATERFDLLIANPPYIATDELAKLAPEVQKWEPRMALDGGKQGLEILAKIPAIAQARLKPGGRLLVEIGYDQGEAVETLFRESALNEIKILKDYNRLPRCVIGSK